jgi:hypothetical protein
MTSSAGACRPKVSTVDHSSPALVGGDVPNQARPIVVRSRAATATSNLVPAAACNQSYLALDPMQAGSGKRKIKKVAGTSQARLTTGEGPEGNRNSRRAATAINMHVLE